MTFGNKLVKKRRTRIECCSFRWFLLSLIIIAGIYQMAALYYYLASTAAENYDDSARNPLPEPSLPHSKSTQHIRNGENNNSIPSKGNGKNKVDVIVYLAQFGHHSSYGAQVDANQKPITGISKLNKSLELLYTNYVDQFPADVIIFHDHGTPPDNDTIASLSHNRPHLQFRSLDPPWWSLPFGLQPWEHFLWRRPAFSVGYRLMMRWFAVLIWFYLDAEGYSHCMRLDDDSYILTEIEYNLFDFMRDNNKRYAFRQPVYEPGGEEFDAVIDKYLVEHSNDTSMSRELIDLYKQDDGVAFYNNFFMADISFFLKPPAASLLRVIDESKLMFTHRTGDLVIQSAVVRLFLPPDQVHWFQDFTYEHMTLCGKDKCGPMIRKGCDHT